MQPVLRHRLITAFVLIPLFVGGTLFLPSLDFAVLTGIVVVLAAWEWSNLIGFKRAWHYAYAAVILTVMAAVYFYLIKFNGLYALFIPVVIWWLFSLLWIILSAGKPARIHAPAGETNTAGRFVDAVIGAVLLVPAWGALVTLHESRTYGPSFVLFLFILVWVADSTAYGVGRRWGKAKLAPHISPGKTWLGLVGALGAAVPVSVGGAAALGLTAGKSLTFALIGLITVAFSVVGDLLESVFKRRAGVKDSGTLLPGHGGVLDRIDSVLAAAPVYMMGLLSAGIPN